MLAAIRSAAVLGIDAYDITVEVDATQGLPQWTIVGLPLGAVKESRERVGSALINSGFALPPRRITINRSRRCQKGRDRIRSSHRARNIGRDRAAPGAHCRGSCLRR